MQRAREAVSSNAGLTQIVKDVVGAYIFGLFTFLAFVKEALSPLYRLAFAGRRPVVVRTPDDRFVGAALEEQGYNFATNYVRVPLGSGRTGDRPRQMKLRHFVSEPLHRDGEVRPTRLHYIDECLGGDPSCTGTVLLLHGATSWSFTFRKLVPLLVNGGYRVVAPDLIGFGKSDKYVDAENYTHEMHTFAVKHLLNELGLGCNIVVVGQDLGGIIGMSVVKDAPEKFDGIVLMNSALPTGFSAEEILRNSPIETARMNLPFLVLRATVALFGTGLPIGQVYRRFFGFDSKLSRAYTSPYPADGVYRNGVTRMIMSVPVYRDDPVSQHMVEAKSCLRTWTKPVMLMWGETEVMASAWKDELVTIVPQAKVVRVPEAGYMMTETHGTEVANALLEFLTGRLGSR